MAAKDNKEMSAFAKAKRDRETLLGQVERCESSANLAKLQQKEKNLAPPRQTLKPSHAAIIAGLDNKLAQSLVVKAKLLVEKEKEAQLQASLKKLLDDEDAAKNQLPSTKPTAANLSEDPTIDVKKEKRLSAVRAQLTVMSEKAKYFSDEYKKTKAQRYLDAYNAAQNLISKVEDLTNQYASGKINLARFKTDANALLGQQSKDADVKELQKHRGWKEIFVNVLAAIVGGLIYLAAAAYTGSFTLFRPETNAAKKVNDLNMAIGQVEVDENEPELILETRGFSCSK